MILRLSLPHRAGDTFPLTTCPLCTAGLRFNWRQPNMLECQGCEHFAVQFNQNLLLGIVKIYMGDYLLRNMRDSIWVFHKSLSDKPDLILPSGSIDFDTIMNHLNKLFLLQ